MLPLLIILRHWLCIIRQHLTMAIIQLGQIYGRANVKVEAHSHIL